MEPIIKKAIQGGFKKGKLILTSDGINNYSNPEMFFLDPLFWQALGKACGWGKDYDGEPEEWLSIALRFYEINLTEGWDKAVAYLAEITK